MDSRPIITEAREHLKAWRALPYPAEIVPSQLWSHHIGAQVEPIIQGMDTAEEVIERVTSHNITTGPTSTDHPLFKKISATQQRWLKGFGRPLSDFPVFMQESPLSSTKVCSVMEGRRYSTAFLYHLSTAAHLEAAVGKYDTALELGSGYGGLARVLKLLNPKLKMVLCDLPETLYLCYVFLRRHFPHCSFEVFDGQNRPSAKTQSADFAFLPAQLAGGLAGFNFDVAINTASLSEMTQVACDWYLRLIEKSMQVNYLYHLNRFGSPETFLENACSTSFGLDRNWEVLDWKWRGDGNFTNAHPEWPPLLNLVVRRIPEQLRSDILYAGMIDTLRRKLATVRAGTDEWHAVMWNLVRIGKQRADIQTYLTAIKRLNWRETVYYESLLESAKPA